LKIPKNIDYNLIPDIIKNCVGEKKWRFNKYSVEIEEIYMNEILNYVILYFGKPARIKE